MEAILLLLGGVVGFFISLYFSGKTKEDLDESASSIERSLEEEIRGLATQLSATHKLLQYSISQVKEVAPEKAVELEQDERLEMRKSKDVVNSIPAPRLQGIDTSVFRDARPCPICGSESFQNGYGADQSGAYVFWFQCPKHGRFPSNHIEDMFD